MHGIPWPWPWPLALARGPWPGHGLALARALGPGPLALGPGPSCSFFRAAHEDPIVKTLVFRKHKLKTEWHFQNMPGACPEYA